MGDYATVCCEMVEKTAGRAIRSVYRAEEPPRLWEQLTDCGGTQLGEIRTTMDGSEMTQISAIGRNNEISWSIDN